MNVLSIIGRENSIITEDVNDNEKILSDEISGSKFLILGAAGSIGQAVTKEIFKRKPLQLDLIDISENNLVELVRDLRSSYGYIKGSFKTLAIDIGSEEYDAFIESDGKYDYVLNFSALKHVRSESNPFTLMRMIEVNILNTIKTINYSIEKKVKKYFCVSTDKATMPINMMGASKRIMEMFLSQLSTSINISTARFANVAFSDGSLLHGYNNRIIKKQPLVIPENVERYFVTSEESGLLCLMSCILGKNREIFFPKINSNFKLIGFKHIATRFLEEKKYQPYFCKDENEARDKSVQLIDDGMWPCLITPTDTSGEKSFEEFFTDNDEVIMDRYKDLGIIINKNNSYEIRLDNFLSTINIMKKNKSWTKQDIVELFKSTCSNFNHKETGNYLDSKM